MIVRYHIEAVEEYDYAVRYYTSISPRLAAQLIEEIEYSVDRISSYPFHGREIRSLTRTMHINIFPYLLIYMIDREVITILAIAHDKRDPEYWLHRAN